MCCKSLLRRANLAIIIIFLFLSLSKFTVSNFTKWKWLNGENLEEILVINNSKDSKYYDNSCNGHTEMSSENRSRPISLKKNEEYNCSDNEEKESDILHCKWIKAFLKCFSFIREQGIKVEIQNSENPQEYFELFITLEVFPVLFNVRLNITQQANKFMFRQIDKVLP